jgi:hypothetical protein
VHTLDRFVAVARFTKRISTANHLDGSCAREDRGVSVCVDAQNSLGSGVDRCPRLCSAPCLFTMVPVQQTQSLKLACRVRCQGSIASFQKIFRKAFYSCAAAVPEALPCVWCLPNRTRVVMIRHNAYRTRLRCRRASAILVARWCRCSLGQTARGECTDADEPPQAWRSPTALGPRPVNPALDFWHHIGYHKLIPPALEVVY